MVLDDEACEGDDDGRGAALCVSAPAAGGALSSSSGLAMRRFPKLRSFMMGAGWPSTGGSWPNERQVTGCPQRVAARSMAGLGRAVGGMGAPRGQER